MFDIFSGIINNLVVLNEEYMSGLEC